jgi:phage terminase large subunit-like protein
VDFISTIKHFLGKSAGKPFILEPFQEFILINLFLKYRDTGFRVATELYIQVARKAGKDAFMAAIALYLMIIEGEASPEIVCAANSTDQARILFNYITQFSKSIDPREAVIRQYRNYVESEFNNGICKVISSDASRADGMNISAFFLDEFHEAKDRLMYDVLKSSQGMREQPLAVIITTAGFNLESPCHDMYELAVQVLGGIKEMDNFFPFIWQLDEGDDWTDPKNFIKCQPNLGVTVTEEFMLGEVNKAKVDPTAEVGVKTKTLNMWCTSEFVWIKPEAMVQLMKDMKLEDYAGYPCIVGVDLSSVGDMTAISALIPLENKRIFFNWSFLPEDTYKNSPNRAIYEKFHKQGELDITPGNVIDHDYITNKIAWINTICPVIAIYYDPFNSSQWAVNMTELGYNLQPYGQNIGNMTRPTKEFQRLVLSGEMVMEKSSNILWQLMCATIKEDPNQNIKVVKQSYSRQKIDNIIACITALGGFLKEGGIATDFEVFCLE